MKGSMMESLPPIGLAELTDRAALLTRVDRKYVLPTAGLWPVLEALPPGARVLEIEGRRSFAYQSSYFDSPELECYLAAARKRRKRFKVRIRSYVDTGANFVEVKTRGPRGNTVKQRAPLSHDSLAFARDVLGRDVVGFGPVLTTKYVRATLFMPDSGCRVTVDTGLMWALPGGTPLRVPGLAIVETKSRRGASEVDRLLWSLKHRPISMSKYCTGLAALRPDLPSNRWRPVLRRHFHQLRGTENA